MEIDLKSDLFSVQAMYSSLTSRLLRGFLTRQSLTFGK